MLSYPQSSHYTWSTLTSHHWDKATLQIINITGANYQRIALQWMNNFSMSHFLNCQEGPELITDSQWNKTSCSLLSTFVIVAPQCPRLPGILSLETYNPVHWTLATAVEISLYWETSLSLYWQGELNASGGWGSHGLLVTRQAGCDVVLLCCTLQAPALQGYNVVLSYNYSAREMLDGRDERWGQLASSDCWHWQATPHCQHQTYL